MCGCASGQTAWTRESTLRTTLHSAEVVRVHAVDQSLSSDGQYDHKHLPLLFPAKQSISTSAGSVGKASSVRAAFLNFASFIYLITSVVYKTGSSSKHPSTLWIRPFFSTGSTVYVMLDVLNKRCIRLARNAYRSGGCEKSRRSAHSLLWIYMTLSTVTKSHQPNNSRHP